MVTLILCLLVIVIYLASGGLSFAESAADMPADAVTGNADVEAPAGESIVSEPEAEQNTAGTENPNLPNSRKSL